jgi:zinc D-Ala-D-Ala carboxypeptidase
MKISEHLDLSELIRSESAKRNGISNMPTEEHIANFKVLAEKVFEPIRNNFRCPIHISSGYRSKDLNIFIGGSLSSQHCKGEAIDIDMDGSPNGVTNKMVYDYIKDNLQFDQLIWEFGNDSNPDWVHVSYNKNKNRGQKLKATKSNGKTIYTNIT